MLVLALVLTGCAPKSLRDGVPWMTARHKVADASAQRVDTWPCMRFNLALFADLEDAASEPDLDSARAKTLDAIEQARGLSLQSTRNELDRLPDEGWRELNETYFRRSITPDAAQRARIWDTFVHQTDVRFASMHGGIREAQSLDELRSCVDKVLARVEAPVATRGATLRAAPWFLFSLPSALAVANLHAHEYRGDLDRPFEQATRYIPVLALRDYTSDEPPPIHWELLRRFAPVIVQENASNPAYDPAIDRIGEAVARDENMIAIDVSRPAVYAYARDVLIDDHHHVQLVYTFWYPEHPALKPNFDPEAGKISGMVLRLTLDRAHQPAVYETLYACGCFHRTYPTQRLELMAADTHGTPQQHKRYAIERNVRGRIDLIVPKLVDGAERADHPVLRTAAGYHGIIDVATTEADHVSEVRDEVAYELLPYAALEHLELPDGRVTSMFYDNGLVKGAERAEGVFFTPIGILSAGQPRQRGTQLIHWDHWLFDDPALLADAMRLPDDF